MVNRARSEALALSAVVREYPYQISDVLERLRDGTFSVQIANPGIDQLDQNIHQATNRIAVALVILGGLVGSAIIGVFAKGGPHIIGIHLFALAGFVVSSVFGLWLVWGVFRHGRL